MASTHLGRSRDRATLQAYDGGDLLGQQLTCIPGFLNQEDHWATSSLQTVGCGCYALGQIRINRRILRKIVSLFEDHVRQLYSIVNPKPRGYFKAQCADFGRFGLSAFVGAAAICMMVFNTQEVKSLSRSCC
jgi:hypothetical protein